MESHLTEEASWASGAAARLRLVQANFADEEPAHRQNYLAEELERSLKTVPPSRREAHLQALGVLFPEWIGGIAAAPAPVAPVESRTPETPEELLERFLQSTATLPAAQRAEVIRRLQQAGLAPAPKESGGAVVEVPPEFWKFFGVTDRRSLDMARCQKMLMSVTGVFLALDQLAWTLWRQLNAKSVYRKESEFGKLAGPYLSGDAEVSTEQVRQPLERTRRLIAALLGAMGRGSSSFAQKHNAELSPDAVENAARGEKKAWESLEAASWRKYKEMSREYSTEQMLENKVQTEYVKAAEELLKGIGR